MADLTCRNWVLNHDEFPFHQSFDLIGNGLSASDIYHFQLHDLVLPDAHGSLVGQDASPRGSRHVQDPLLFASSPSNAQISHTSNAELETTSRSSIEPELPSMHGSLEEIPGAFSFYIGPTGAADVHLLNREAYDANDVARPRLSGLKYRRLGRQSSRGNNPTIFGITDLNLLENAEPRVESSTIETTWAELWNIIDPQTAWRLIKLYGRFIDPCFPIISMHQLPSCPEELSNMPLGLLAALCASALPFVMYDESLYSLLLHPPSSQQLYRLAWLDISQQFHAPSLATLQACLLLQQRLPTNAYLSDTAFSWTLISSAVAIAQTVGLHCDPSDWVSVPLWERRLRKRLWWALWIMEKWFSLTRGMPSHIHEDDFEVPELTEEDISDTLSSLHHTKTHLCQLAKITRILADIQKTYFTVRAIGRTSHDLQLSLDLARSTRAQLKEWRDSLPPEYQFAAGIPPELRLVDTLGSRNDERDMDGSGSIHLAYIVTHMTLFRALLRPLDCWRDKVLQSPTGAESLYHSAKAVIRGSIFCVKNFVEFLETLTSPQWNAFWHSWSRANFAIGGSFIVNLLHITSTSGSDGSSMHNLGFENEDRELRDWIKRWRSAIRLSASGAAGAKGLANLGLLRVETMLSRVLVAEENGKT